MTRGQIISAVLAIIDAEGVEALTMRPLGIPLLLTPRTDSRPPTKQTTCSDWDSTGCPSPSFPRLRSMAILLVENDGAAELDAGLGIVLAGLRSRLSSC